MDKEKFWNDLKSGQFVSMVRESSKGKKLVNSKEVFNVMKPMFADYPDIEVMYTVLLNARNRIMGIEKLAEGTISRISIYPRELVKLAIKNQATAVVLVHNHPSGDIEPSLEDRVITRTIWISLYCIDVTLHDHIIVGDSYYSMADNGLIKRIRTDNEGLFQS